MKRVLYLSYDGLSDPLGQSQVLPYLVGLARAGFDLSLITFEKPSRIAKLRPELSQQVRDAGINWHPLSYTKSPPVLSTMWDVRRMRKLAFRLHRDTPFDLVHCRSYLPSLVGLELKRSRGVRFLFDMRGFWADEKVDATAWPLGHPVYRTVYSYFKRKEREFFAEAGAVVSLTHAGMRVIHQNGWLSETATEAVIPCSVDFDMFRIATSDEMAQVRKELGFDVDALVVTYLGSLGTWYMLEEMLDFLATLIREQPRVRMLFITQDDPSIVFAAAAARGIPSEVLLVRAAARDKVPGLLAASDFGLFFIRPTPSKISSSPTKLGEYLAMGIPVITNAGVGDVAENLEDTGGGVLVEDFTEDAYRRAVALLPGLRMRNRAEVRDRAKRIFDLRAAVKSYERLYRALLEPSNTTAGEGEQQVASGIRDPYDSAASDR